MKTLDRPETGDLDVLIATVRILDLEEPIVEDQRTRLGLLVELTSIGLALERLLITTRSSGLGETEEHLARECRDRIEALRPYWPVELFLLMDPSAHR